MIISKTLRKYIYGVCKLHCLREEGRGEDDTDFVEADYLKDDLQTLWSDLSDSDMAQIDDWDLPFILQQAHRSGYRNWPHGFTPLDSTELLKCNE